MICEGVITTIMVTATLSMEVCAPHDFEYKVPESIQQELAQKNNPVNKEFLLPQRIFELSGKNSGHSSYPKCTYNKRVKVYQGDKWVGYKKVEVACGKYNRSVNKMFNSVHTH